MASRACTSVAHVARSSATRLIAGPAVRTTVLCRKLSTAAGDASSGSTQKPILHRLIESALIGGVLYCAYELGQVIWDFPAPCQAMLDKARANNDLLVTFGGKISHSLLWQGSVKEDVGRASVTIPIDGPSGRKGVLYGRAVKDDSGKWVLLNAEAHVLKREDGGAPIPAKAATTTHPYDAGVEAIFDLLSAKGAAAGPLERKDIDVRTWKEGAPGTPGAPAAAAASPKQ